MRESQVRIVRLGDGVVFLDPRELVAVQVQDHYERDRQERWQTVSIVFRGAGAIDAAAPCEVGADAGTMSWLRGSLLERGDADEATLERVAGALYRDDQGRSDWSKRDPADPSVVHYRRIAKVALAAVFEVAP